MNVPFLTNDLKGHIAFFVAAAVLMIFTCDRGEVLERARDLPLMWDRDTADFRLLDYSTPVLNLTIERRTDDGREYYYWGTQKLVADSSEELEFPVGWAGRAVVPRVAALRALRDLGPLSPDQRESYGIEGSDASLTIGFGDERRELVVGDSVFGGDDRYAMEVATGRGMVISREVIDPLQRGEGAVRERELHDFARDRIATVVVNAEGRERTMERTGDGEWTAPGATDPDPGFANFMERVNQLGIDGFRDLPPAESLKPVLRIDYLDRNGDPLAFMEVSRDESGERPSYFIRSERTRIFARAHRALTDRVEQALADLF